MNFQEKIKIGENRFLELKVDLPTKKQLAHTAIAFSNGAGGEIIIGVNDNGEIIGVEDNKIDEYLDKITNIITDNCSPYIIPAISKLNINNKLLIVVKIYPGSSKPYFMKSLGSDRGTYIRIGATNKVADKSALAELARQRLNISFDEEPAYNAQTNQFNIEKFISDFNDLSNKKIKENDLYTLKLFVKENDKKYLSNGALIIAGIPENTLIKCAKFKGTTTDEFIDRKEFQGMLYEVIEKVIGFLKTHLLLRGTFGELQRVDRYEIPIEALREAVINAVVHRDYSIESDIKIAVFDDIVEIISPGLLPKNVTLEEIKEGLSEVRNKVVARIFKEIKYIEQWGSGISRMINACKSAGLQIPLFEETGGFFKVVFYRENNQLSKITASIGGNEGKPAEKDVKTGGNEGKPAEKDVKTGGIEEKPAEKDVKTGGKKDEKINKTEYQKAEIINYLLEFGEIDNNKVQLLIKVKKSRAREIINIMVQNKQLKKCSLGKNTYYILERT